jgi:O-antigen ligase
MSLLAIIQLMRRPCPKPLRLLHGVAAAMTFYGALLTQSRGPLLAFAVALVLVLSLHFHRQRAWSFTAGAVAGALLLIGGGSLSLNDKIRERFLEVHTEVVSYSPARANGAVRERLEMWRTAWRAFREHPWNGVGVNQFGKYSQAQVALGNANESIAKYQHPHSEYLEALSTLGVTGGITIILIFVLPLIYFLRHAGDPCERVATQAGAGAGVVLLFALCALTDNVFYRPMPQSIYMFFVLGLVLSIAYQHRRMIFGAPTQTAG